MFKKDQKKKKNIGQSNDNLINYLSKDYGYSKESANKVIEEGVKKNMVRIALFYGKNSYRLVENRENTIIVSKTQLNDTQQNDADATEAFFWGGKCIAIEDTVVGTPTKILNDEIISTLKRKFEKFSESIESMLLDIEEQIIGAKDSLFQLIEKSPFWAGTSNHRKGCYY